MVGADDAFTLRLLSEAGLRPGLHVLDVGCGAGDVSLMAADLVGPAGRVTGLDRDVAALEAARARAAGRPEVEFVAGDAGAPPDGPFDAIVGRRVLMYQADLGATLEGLAARLRPGGVVAFQEHDATLGPASLAPMRLHRRAQGWLRETVVREGADPQAGFRLHGAAVRAGLRVEAVRAEAIVQTPDQPYALAGIVRAVLPRIVAAGAATEAEIDIDTLAARLDAERAEGTYVAGHMFGLIARKAG